MLTRVYGTAFFKQDELEAHLEQLEEARARDHRKLGRELGLFTFSPVSPGSTFWLPKGTAVFNALVALNRAHAAASAATSRSRRRCSTSRTLWETSGHWGKYKDNIFVVGVRGPRVRPQADELPGPRAPVRRCSTGPTATCRSATPSRACCTAASRAARCTACCACATSSRTTPTSSAPRSRSRTRSRSCLDFAYDDLRHVRLPGARRALDAARRPPRRRRVLGPRRGHAGRGARDRRASSTRSTRARARSTRPKIDLHMTDSLGRSWQLGTVQLDYNMPERFGSPTPAPTTPSTRPVMIHRALFGSFERFIGILIEHYAGELPLWLAPVQADRAADRRPPHRRRARRPSTALRAAGLRAEVDDRTESVGRKIRDAELQKVPYMLVVGDREAEEGTVAVRRHGEGDEGTVALGDVRRAAGRRGRARRPSTGLRAELAAPRTAAAGTRRAPGGGALVDGLRGGARAAHRAGRRQRAPAGGGLALRGGAALRGGPALRPAAVCLAATARRWAAARRSAASRARTSRSAAARGGLRLGRRGLHDLGDVAGATGRADLGDARAALVRAEDRADDRDDRDRDGEERGEAAARGAATRPAGAGARRRAGGRRRWAPVAWPRRALAAEARTGADGGLGRRRGGRRRRRGAAAAAAGSGRRGARPARRAPGRRARERRAGGLAARLALDGLGRRAASPPAGAARARRGFAAVGAGRVGFAAGAAGVASAAARGRRLRRAWRAPPGRRSRRSPCRRPRGVR